MSTAEIIAELPRLSPAELAEVQAKLRELVEPARLGTPSKSTAARISSPRLARREQSKDFIKQILEPTRDAKA